MKNTKVVMGMLSVVSFTMHAQVTITNQTGTHLKGRGSGLYDPVYVVTNNGSSYVWEPVGKDWSGGRYGVFFLGPAGQKMQDFEGQVSFEDAPMSGYSLATQAGSVIIQNSDPQYVAEVKYFDGQDYKSAPLMGGQSKSIPARAGQWSAPIKIKFWPKETWLQESKSQERR